MAALYLHKITTLLIPQSGNSSVRNTYMQGEIKVTRLMIADFENTFCARRKLLRVLTFNAKT